MRAAAHRLLAVVVAKIVVDLQRQHEIIYGKLHDHTAARVLRDHERTIARLRRLARVLAGRKV